MSVEKRLIQALEAAVASEEELRYFASRRLGREPTEQEVAEERALLEKEIRNLNDTSHRCPCCGVEDIALQPTEKICFDCFGIWRCIKDFCDDEYHPLEPEMAIRCRKETRERVLRIAEYLDGRGINLRVARHFQPEDLAEDGRRFFGFVVQHPGSARSVKSATSD